MWMRTRAWTERSVVLSKTWVIKRGYVNIVVSESDACESINHDAVGGLAQISYLSHTFNPPTLPLTSWVYVPFFEFVSSSSPVLAVKLQLFGTNLWRHKHSHWPWSNPFAMLARLMIRFVHIRWFKENDIGCIRRVCSELSTTSTFMRFWATTWLVSRSSLYNSMRWRERRSDLYPTPRVTGSEYHWVLSQTVNSAVFQVVSNRY